MSDEFWPGFLCGVMLTLGGCGYLAILAVSSCTRDAVAHGCAEYVMDPATGESEWRWIEAKP